MRIQSSIIAVAILAAFSSSTPVTAAIGKPARVIAYFAAIERDEKGEFARLIMNPMSTGAITIRIRKGTIQKEFLKTFLDVELNVPNACVTNCEAELIRLVDIVAPHDITF